MNTVILIGRLTKDPEIRYTQDQKPVCRFNLAVDRPYKKDETDFFNVVVFGKVAENVEKYLSKGSQVGVEGSIQNNNYEDKNGVKHYGNNIIANRVDFLSYGNQNKEKNNTNEDYKQVEIEDDELPF